MLRVRKYLNELLVDQLPVLTHVQVHLCYRNHAIVAVAKFLMPGIFSGIWTKLRWLTLPLPFDRPFCWSKLQRFGTPSRGSLLTRVKSQSIN